MNNYFAEAGAEAAPVIVMETVAAPVPTGGEEDEEMIL